MPRPLRHAELPPPLQDDLQRDWRAMGWSHAGDGKFIATAGVWAERAIIVPFGTLPTAEQAKRQSNGWATDLDDMIATIRAAAGQPPPRPDDLFAGLIDGTLCRAHDGGPMTWLDRESSGWTLHQYLRTGCCGPALRFRSRAPWQRFVTLDEGGVVWRRVTARGRRPAEVLVAAHDDPWGRPVQWWRATRDAAVFETVAGISRFATPEAAMHAANTEVGVFR